MLNLLKLIAILLFGILANGHLIAAKNPELARIAILPIEDRTGSNDYEYLSSSLSNAINISMLKNFTYYAIRSYLVKNSIYEIEQKKPRAKNDEQLDQNAIQIGTVKEIAKDLSAEIVIFGSFLYDKETNELVFTISIYYTALDQVKQLDEARNAINQTLFMATKKVAKILVSEIYRMAQEAQENTSMEVDEKKGNKIEITKNMVARSFDWSTKKISISVLGGFFKKSATYGDPFANGLCGVCKLQFALAGRYWILPRFYLGMKIDFSEIWTPTLNYGSISAIDGLAFAGLSIPANRWLFSADLGIGYYVINDDAFGKIYNPAFAFRIGAELMLTTYFSAGVTANINIYYDEPVSLYFGGLMLSLNYLM
ncbi:MAG: hypothetical protein ABUK01_12705 [Leptospirales bacterium]